MSTKSRILREPLLHFVVAGAVLFSAFSLFRGGSADSDDATIEVGRRELLTFLQYRANAFDAETFGAALDAMTDAELDEVVNAYINEEVLYREARALGLERSDNIIRQRMVQKMSFQLTDAIAENTVIDPDELETYFRKNIDAYAIEPWVTFTHVFFDADRRGADGAREAALAALAELNVAGATFNDVPPLGDRFPFNRNYIERTLEFVASHFGMEFADQIAQATPSATTWQGPFRSVYGEHIVLLTHRAERSYPELEDVRANVERDFLNERNNRALDTVMQRLRQSYRIEIGPLRSKAE